MKQDIKLFASKKTIESYEVEASSSSAEWDMRKLFSVNYTEDEFPCLIKSCWDFALQKIIVGA